MNTISSVSPTGTSGVSNSEPSRVPQKTLGQNDFLQLLAAQFKTQDPMKPIEDTAFIAQMAQFTALEQSSSMSKELAEMRADQKRATANSYLGHRVTVDAGNGATAAGDVTAIDASGGDPSLVINGKNFPLSSVLRVEPGAITLSQATSTQPAI